MKIFGIEFGSGKKPLLNEAIESSIEERGESTGTDGISFKSEPLEELEIKEVVSELQMSRETETIKFSPTKAVKPNEEINMHLLVQIAGQNNIEKKFPVIYSYSVNDEKYEVVVGQIGACNNLSEQAKRIIELYKNQLVSNARGEEGLEYVEKIKDLSRTDQNKRSTKVPFDFTLEGIEIITQKDPFVKEFKRTQIIKESNEGLQINGVYKYFELEQMKKQKYKELAEIEKANMEAKKAQYIAEKAQENILKTLEKASPELRGQYITGEKIAQYVTTKNQCENRDGLTCFCKTSATEFMHLNHLNEKNDELGSKSSLEQFVEIKEKGFSTDVIGFLNQIDEKINESIKQKIEEGKMDSLDKRVEKLEELQHYRLLFKLLEAGRSSNFNLLLQTGKLNLHTLKDMFEKCGIQEKDVLQFLEHKQNTIAKLDDNKELNRQAYLDKDNIVKNYYEFMTESPSRNSTKEEEENMILMESDVISTVMIQNNKKSMLVYSAIAGDAAKYHIDTKLSDERSLSSNLSTKILPQQILDVFEVQPSEIENYKETISKNNKVCSRPNIDSSER